MRDGVADIMLPSRVGEKEANKISAGENVLVIRTPTGMYIRTNKGRVYAVHPGNQLSRSDSRSAWNDEPSVQQCSRSLFGASSARLVSDVWSSSSSGFDSVHSSVQYSDTAGEMSMLDGDPNISQSLSARRGPASSVISSDKSADVCNIDPMFFLNTTTSYDGNLAWNSSTTHQSMTRVMSDEIPASSTQRPLYQHRSWSTVESTVQESSISDLPSDLLCIDASCVTDRTDTTLPALTVRHQTPDTDSLDSLTFDDYDSFAYSRSSDVDPLFSSHSSRYDTHSNINVTDTPSLSSVAATTDMLDWM